MIEDLIGTDASQTERRRDAFRAKAQFFRDHSLRHFAISGNSSATATAGLRSRRKIRTFTREPRIRLVQLRIITPLDGSLRNGRSRTKPTRRRTKLDKDRISKTIPKCSELRQTV